ncbi:helix-turn-helix domain-containing protein [Haloterrigena sp. SYSU A558-1]|uniref:Helix-turn-helix domain-containing protein n=2 Tax=Haloterrigena gelatinilytica TaxID=2741724 RepID=A0A8J8KIK3_9EURY|nr:helix-turn-helix domain-containing protein [Haloterrigena gelatinilytica]NUC71789.1 helix-turn-helix domain-containing protein [Haloterrigena gelatinilytica]
MFHRRSLHVPCYRTDGERIEAVESSSTTGPYRPRRPVGNGAERTMSLVATVVVPAAEFQLGSLLDTDEDVTLTVETTVPTSESVVPYFWAPADVADSIVATLESDRTVAAVSIVDELDDHVLVKIAWNDRVDGVLETIRERDVIVTSAVGTESRWTFRLRFPSSEDLSAFYSSCLERDISIELVRLHETGEPSGGRGFGLTTAQRELLVAAYEAGYFDVPRRTTLVELGDRLDVSDSAVSQRLRRGLAALIGSTIAVDADDEPASPSRRLDEELEVETQSDP